MTIQFVITIATSIVVGGLIGMERQWRNKLAGMRTTALVCLGACIVVLLSTFIEDASSTRIAAQVVSGIGFLAGGVIVRDGFTVKGINTAATLWCAAAVGSMIGLGFLLEGLVCGVFITLVNVIVRNVSYRIDQLNLSYQTKEATGDLYYLSVLTAKKDEQRVGNEINQLIASTNLLILKQYSAVEVSEDVVESLVIVENHSRAGLELLDSVIQQVDSLAEVLEVTQLYAEAS